jgi:hypothetical protein
MAATTTRAATHAPTRIRGFNAFNIGEDNLSL